MEPARYTKFRTLPCGKFSRRVHSHYTRSLSDLPAHARCHGTLAHEQRPGPVGHEDRLLLDRLCRNEAHRATLHGRAVVEAIETHGATAHIPSQSNVRVVRSVAPEIYRNRNLIERFFNRLRHFRGIATRYNKLARNSLAAVLLASARIWLKHYESTT